MSESLNIGQIITTPQNRDAIHVAVAPVVASVALLPGKHIGLLPDGTASVNPPFIGVVDPFLTRRVQPGERFWMFLKPGTITSLRHEWTHPAFESVTAAAVPEEKNDPVSVSTRWIENFAASIEQTYNALMRAADRWVECQDYTYDNSESYKGQWDKFPEFWTHYEVVRQVKVTVEKDSFFTCSC